MGLLGNLSVKLGIDTSQFVAGLNKAAASTNNFSQKIATSFKATSASTKKASTEMNLFAKETAKAYKDVGRIAQGILVSQLFYTFLRTIKEATKALAEFSSQCEQAEVSFSILMGDAAKAERFMGAIQDFAADTPLTMQQSVNQARKLLAYGFEDSNIVTVMEALADASAASGDAESFQRIGKALGQIHTKGRLAGQEMLQLTEAGIPAYDILQEKLGLTKEQLAKIGNLRIPADVAIKAILEGMNERYGGAADAISNTAQGMISTIKDNMLIIGQDITGNIYNSFKGMLMKMRDALDDFRSIVRKVGFGGLMDLKLPPELAAQIRLLGANFIMLGQNVRLFVQAISPVLNAFAQLYMVGLNMVLPVINAISRVILTLVGWLTSCNAVTKFFVGTLGSFMIVASIIKLLTTFAAVIKGLFIVKALAQLVLFLAGAFRVLAIAIATNPLIAFLALGVGALLTFGIASGKVSKLISGIGGKISTAFGVDPSKVFEPKMEKNVDIAGEFSDTLEKDTEALDDMGKAAKKAAKKAKESMLSFDELFTLNLPDEADTSGALDDAYDLDTGDIEIPSVDMGAVELPDMSNKVSQWVERFKMLIVNNLKNALIGATIGGVIGGILGSAFGHPIIGAAIGAGVGAIVGLFWTSMSDQFRNSFKGAGIGAIIGLMLGLAFGHPLIGASIGAGVGSIVGYFWDSLAQEFKNAITGAGIGATIGMSLGLAFGSPLIGAAIGAAVGGMAGYFKDAFIKYFDDAITGMKERISGYWDQVTKYFKDAFSTDSFKQFGVDIVEGILFGMGAVMLTIFDVIWTIVVQPIIDAIKKLFGIESPAKTMIPIGKNLILGIIKGITGGMTNIFSKLKTFGLEIIKGFSTWVSDTKTSVKEWAGEVTESISNWVSDTKENLSEWWKTTTEDFSNWKSDTSEKFKTWASENKEKIVTWASETKIKIGAWASETKAKIAGWYSETKTKIASWASENTAKIGAWASDSLAKVTKWWSDTKTGFNNWSYETGVKVGTWKTNLVNTIGGFVSEAGAKFKSFWADAPSKFATWSKNCYTSALSWFGKLGTKLADFFKTMADGVKELGKDPVNINVNKITSTADSFRSMRTGAANGAIALKDQLLRVGEGNKREAIIPLENDAAMAPFSNAVANSVASVLGPIIAQFKETSSNPTGTDLRPLYVGTLVADERGLRELNKQLRVIELREDRGRG